MWINTWLTIVSVAAWLVAGLVVTGAAGGWWVSGGAVALAIGLPVVLYRYAKASMLRLLYRFDPPQRVRREARPRP